jgi:hypothetical protein
LFLLLDTRKLTDEESTPVYPHAASPKACFQEMKHRSLSGNSIPALYEFCQWVNALNRKRIALGPNKGSGATISNEDKRDCSHLRRPNTNRIGRITYDAKDLGNENPQIEQLRPPKGAPNVLIVPIEELGLRRAMEMTDGNARYHHDRYHARL